jgi:hypothetical protein
MSAPRAWLIEALDGAGAAPEDVRLHARALEHAGWDVRAFVAGASGLEPLPPDRVAARRESAGVSSIAPPRERPDLAIAASVHAGGGAAARHLPRGAAWAWWPTGLATPARWRIGRNPAPLAFGSAAPGCAGLEGSTSDAAPRKRAVPLWDGEVVVVPAALERRAGAAIVRAFADAAADRGGLDLVVLSEPQPAFATLAREAGIGPRLHFAGAATREAEHAWLSSAAALVVDGDAPLSGGLVLRALKRGVPVVPAGGGGTAEILRAWLAGRGCLPVGADGLEASLGWAIERGAEAARAQSQGRALAAEHDLAALAGRLGAALGQSEGRRAA